MKHLLLILTTIFLATSCSPKMGNQIKNLTGDKISENFIKAIGGEKKLRNVKSITMIAVATIQEIELQIESYRKAPDKMLVRMKSPQGTMTRILNGEKAFVIAPNGKQPITGVDLEALQEEATIFPELYREKFGHTYEYEGIEEVNGKEMYKVKIQTPNGHQRYQFYEVETNHLKMMIDELGTKSYYDDYRDVEGIKMPYSNKLITPQGALEFKVKELSINPDLEDNMFEVN